MYAEVGEEIVPCAEEHDEEVFHIYTPESEEFDITAIDKEAAIVCTGDAFTRFVGIPRPESELLVAPYYPSEEDWERGMRKVFCAVFDLDGRVKGTLEGAAR